MKVYDLKTLVRSKSNIKKNKSVDFLQLTDKQRYGFYFKFGLIKNC